MESKRVDVLVLVVDIDDDLGRAGVETPVVGYREVARALMEFGLERPEDSDVNAIFKALSVYRELKRQGYSVEVAVLAGDEHSGLRANLRIRRDLERLKRELGFKSIVFVSDGASDERVLPVLQSFGEIIGVERVVVEQSRGVEETFILISKYVKKAINEQPYSKIFLGVPGIIIVSIAIASVLKLTMYLNEIVMIILGAALIIKGFGVIGRTIGLWRKSPILFTTVLLGVVSYASACIVVVATVYTGLTISSFTTMIDAIQALIILGTVSIISGRLIYSLQRGVVSSIWKDVLPLIPLIFIVTVLQRVSYMAKSIKRGGLEDIIKLFSTTEVITLIGLAIIVTITTTILFMVLEHKLSTTSRR